MRLQIHWVHERPQIEESDQISKSVYPDKERAKTAIGGSRGLSTEAYGVGESAHFDAGRLRLWL